MPGPQELRLIQALNGAKPGRAGGGAQEWDECAGILDRVAERLGRASMPIPMGEAGAQTAEAMNAAFARSAEAMSERAVKLRRGRDALRQAEEIMADAQVAREALGPEGSHPGEFRSAHDPKSPAGIRARQDHDTAVAAYEAEQARRERIARQWADQMDAVFTDSANTMRDIHGEPPPPPPPAGYEGGHGGVSAPSVGGSGGGHAGGAGGSAVLGGGGTVPGSGGGGGGGTPGGGGGGVTPIGTGGGTPQGTTITPYDPASPGAGTVGGSSGGGVSPAAGLGVAGAAGGAAAGGLLGAGLTAGGIRGGVPAVVNPGTAQSGVRGIGATSRTGSAGALGRPAGATGTGAAGSGPAARSGSAARSGAGARTGAASAGSRGAAAGRGAGGRAAGGRGAGAAAGGGTRGATGRAAGGGLAGRTGRGKDEERRSGDPFEAPEDWIGEDEAAPAILD